MARRKYVKENNLVKAINTDSLELQKPLVNEYYDINVHNSNMDKIDKGYKQNKNDISSINSELSKTENTKYTTANGIKEFECKDGYVDNVVIEGQTKILNAENQECEAGANGAKLVSVGQGDKIEVLTKNSDETKQDKKQILTTLRSLPNGVKDTIEKRGNKYYKIKRCEEIVLNGSENWQTGNPLTNTLFFNFDTTINSIEGTSDISDKFICKKMYSLDEEGFYVAKTGFRIRINKTKLTTQDLAGFKAWLSRNPVTVVYELETPVIEELPNFNPQTFSDKTTLLLNSGVVQAECDFEVTNSLGSELEVLKGKVSSLDDDISVLQSEVSTNKTNITSNTNLINNYKNRLNDGEIYNQNLEYIIQNYKSGHYYVGNCTGFPYGWGGLQIIRYNSGLNGCLVYHNLEINISTSGTYINYFKNGKLKGWQKITTTSTYSLLEEQVATLETQATENEKKISILTEENEKLKVEQEQQNEEILVNMLANTEMFEMILSMMPMILSEDKNTKNNGGSNMVEVYCTLIIKGVKTIEDVPLVIREQVIERLKQLEVPVK